MNATQNVRVLRLLHLSTAEPTPVRFVPTAEQIASLSSALELNALRKVRLEGWLRPAGDRDWHLEAMLGATVVQPCSVTLAPVTTRIDVPVTRQYLADFVALSDSEAEMPEDDSAEPLPEEIDLFAVLEESLALALPDFPRADGAELGEAVFAPDGQAPLRDDDLKPFAGLADLKNQLEK